MPKAEDRDPCRQKVLVFLDHYLPGFRFGGIVTAVAAMVERLGDQLEFFIVTAPWDEHSQEIYRGIKVNGWNAVGKAQAFYTDDHSAAELRRLVREVQPDVVYLNSFWSAWTVRVLWFRKLGWLPRVPVVLAPRGTFHPSALAIKARKKRLYRTLSDLLRLSSDVCWHASSEHERQDIERYSGADAKIVVAPDLCSAITTNDFQSRKIFGKLRAVAISRLAPIKNFEFLIVALQEARGEVELDLFGPIDEPSYWERLQREIKRLPSNIRVQYAGLVIKEEVAAKLQEYDVHALPSQGENFGYSIVEALSAGVPVVISDQTPWHGLEAARAGFDLPLIREQWTRCLQRLVEMDAAEHESFRRGAVDFYQREVMKPENAAAMLEMFNKAMMHQS